MFLRNDILDPKAQIGEAIWNPISQYSGAAVSINIPRATSFSPTLSIALSSARPIRNSRERSVDISLDMKPQAASPSHLQYNRLGSAKVCRCCVLFHSITKRSRNASEAPEYAALSTVQRCLTTGRHRARRSSQLITVEERTGEGGLDMTDRFPLR